MFDLSVNTLKILHFTGTIMILTGLAALWGVSYHGTEVRRQIRIPLALIHGFGMTLTLLSGLWRLAQLPSGQNAFPGWVWAKAVIWLLLGGSMILAKRKANWGPTVVGVFLSLAIAAGALAITHQ